MMADEQLGEFWRIPECGLEGKWFVDESAVNWNDMTNNRPGAIVRCSHLPAVQYVPPFEFRMYDHIAGMISDAT
jgi:hypothetical protein